MPSICECPSCRCRLELPESAAGTVVKCPRCGATFQPGADGIQSPTSWPVPHRDWAKEPPPAAPGREEEFASPDDRERLAEQEVQQKWQQERERSRPLRDYPSDLPGAGQTTAVLVLLVLTLLADLAGVGTGFLQQQLLSRAAAGAHVAPEEAEANDARVQMVGLLQVGVNLGTLVALCFWIYKAYDNLRLWVDRGLKYSPGWAVGYFFIPILNLFRPYQVTQEIWKASDPAVPRSDPDAWQHSSGSGVVGLWWALWLVSAVIGQFAFRLALQENEHTTLEMAQTITVVNLAADVASLLAALAAILVITQIRSRQQEKFKHLLAEASDSTGDEAL